MKHYTIMINGQAAVDAARRFCGGYCYRSIIEHRKVLAQVEVVIDEPGDYNGIPQKWVSVSYIITGRDVEKTLDQLARLGFRGCPCEVTLDVEAGCIATQTGLFCTII